MAFRLNMILQHSTRDRNSLLRSKEFHLRILHLSSYAMSLGLKHHISRTEKCCESEDRSEWFAGFWRRNFNVKSGQDSNHELIIWKVKLFVASVTCSRYQIAFKWSVNFWLQLLKYTMRNIWVDGFLFRHSSNSKTELAEIWQQTGVCICASKNADWNQQ